MNGCLNSLSVAQACIHYSKRKKTITHTSHEDVPSLTDDVCLCFLRSTSVLLGGLASNALQIQTRVAAWSSLRAPNLFSSLSPSSTGTWATTSRGCEPEPSTTRTTTPSRTTAPAATATAASATSCRRRRATGCFWWTWEGPLTTTTPQGHGTGTAHRLPSRRGAPLWVLLPPPPPTRLLLLHLLLCGTDTTDTNPTWPTSLTLCHWLTLMSGTPEGYTHTTTHRLRGEGQ